MLVEKLIKEVSIYGYMHVYPPAVVPRLSEAVKLDGSLVTAVYLYTVDNILQAVKAKCSYSLYRPFQLSLLSKTIPRE